MAAIPGHQHDAYVRTLARLLASIRDQTAAAVARGETLEQARKSVDLTEFRTLIAGESQLKRVIFHMYVTTPAIDAAYRQASEKR